VHQRQRVRAVCGLVLTLALLHFVPNRLLVLFLLLGLWSVLFFPLSRAELVAFALAALFFLLQNYVCLEAGLFEFRFKDVLLMPYYEPFLWGFYFLTLKRAISGVGRGPATIDARSVAGLIVTSLAFSLFSFDPRALLVATACSTTFLLVMFHERIDLWYALCALALGFVIELFGVSTHLWSYPAPDFLGIPYWFATMWMSAGLLGHRFLIPASEWLAALHVRR
jgi:hypothetical protein